MSQYNVLQVIIALRVYQIQVLLHILAKLAMNAQADLFRQSLANQDIIKTQQLRRLVKIALKVHIVMDLIELKHSLALKDSIALKTLNIVSNILALLVLIIQ